MASTNTGTTKRRFMFDFHWLIVDVFVGAKRARRRAWPNCPANACPLIAGRSRSQRNARSAAPWPLSKLWAGACSQPSGPQQASSWWQRRARPPDRLRVFPGAIVMVAILDTVPLAPTVNELLMLVPPIPKSLLALSHREPP